MASGAIEKPTVLAYIELLALRLTRGSRLRPRDTEWPYLSHATSLGAKYIRLDCLIDNDHANALYQVEGFQEVARQIRWFRKI